MLKPRLTAVRLILVALSALSLSQCNNSDCESLRDELSAQKLSWQGCTRDEDCIKVGGNPGDCTGVLSCDLAVNRRYRAEAERRIASLPEESVDCMVCTSPNCVGGDISICEPVTEQCIIVTELIGPDEPIGTATGTAGAGAN